MNESTLQASPPGSETLYQCVGICMNDPDSGYCIGCGRPPEPLADSTTANDERSTPAPSGTAR